MIMKNVGAVEGEPSKALRLFRADASGAAIGDVLAEFETDEEARRFKLRADWHYVMFRKRKPERWSPTRS